MAQPSEHKHGDIMVQSNHDSERLARLEVKSDYISRDLDVIKGLISEQVETSRNQAFSLGALEKVVQGLMEKAAGHDDECELHHSNTNTRLIALELQQTENSRLHEEVGSLKKEVEMLKQDKIERKVITRIVLWGAEHPSFLFGVALVIVAIGTYIIPHIK